ncbi:hypothetical protein [Cellulosilyticum sp. I15G10I2]|uniref:hypothetical protein n=1 Tax=Cellulosilyticum sp. I15G10I2 TaxID=1892843 RepID=UPI00085C30FD|nr:hypothetical protein [Cellulosilyticum sp. I15G10I2]
MSISKKSVNRINKAVMPHDAAPPPKTCVDSDAKSSANDVSQEKKGVVSRIHQEMPDYLL